jgi:dienelactone hydrolase
MCLCVLATVLAVVAAGCGAADINRYPGPNKDIAFFTAPLDDGSEVSVFYPKDLSGGEPSPLIVFGCGWNQVRKAYYGYAHQLAQWGYVVVVRFYPSIGTGVFANDFVEHHIWQTFDVIDWAAEQNDDPESPLFGRVDADRVGLTGHSMGGTVGVVAPLFDPTIGAVVSLDGFAAEHSTNRLLPGFEHSGTPTLFINAGDRGNCSESPFALYEFYDKLNPPVMEITITGANHMDFMEEDCELTCQIGRYIVCAGGTADPEEVRRLSTKYMINWFNYHLKNDASALVVLEGSELKKDIDRGAVTSRRKD